MEIRGLMQFRSANIESLTFTPADKDPTASLVLSANLTPELAAVMGVEASIFDGDGKPRPRATRIDFTELKLRDIDLSLPSPTSEGAYDLYRPELIYGFRVEVDGMLVRLHLRARVKGRYDELTMFLAGINKDDFDFAIRALQQEFDWSGQGGTGTAVEMGGAKIDGPLFDAPACVHCDAEVPRNTDGFHMIGGELVACPRPNPEAEAGDKSDGPALPAIHVVGSGRGPKQRNRRQPEPPSAEEIEGAVTVQ